MKFKEGVDVDPIEEDEHSNAFKAGVIAEKIRTENKVAELKKIRWGFCMSGMLCYACRKEKRITETIFVSYGRAKHICLDCKIDEVFK